LTLAPNNKPTVKHCVGVAGQKNGVALALDAGSLGVDAFGPEAQYAKLGIGLTLSTASMINSAAHQDMTGTGLGMASYLKAPTELAATSAGWGWGKYIPFAGAAVDAYSAFHDARPSVQSLQPLHGGPLMEKTTTENVTSRTAARWGLVVAVLTFPVAMVVSHFSDPGRGRAAGIALALMIGGIWAFWHQRRQAWFWMAIAALTVIHVVLIVLVPWSDKSFPAPALWPIGIADFAAICGFIKLVEKAMSRGDTASSPS